MSGKPDKEDPKHNLDPAAGQGPPDAAGQAAEPQAGPLETAAKETPHEARIAELEGQIADLTDRLLRSHAEMDNIRKRTEREKTDMAKYAISKFASDMATVGDNFGRAIAALPAGAAEQDPALKGLLDGVMVIEREFLNVLERHGVKRIDPTGEPFNPHLHQAVMEQPNADVPSGTVLQVFQAGYTIEDRVLRPAMVVVSKGGPKQQDAPPAEARPPAGSENNGSASDPDGQGSS